MTTYALSENQRGELLLTDVAHQLTAGGGKPGQGYSAEDSLARTCPLPGSDEGSQATAPASSTSSPASSTLFDPDGYSSRTYPVSSLQTAVGTSEQSLERWPTSGTAWAGGFSTHVTSECRSDDAGCSSSEPSLSEILEPPQNVAARYSLSATSCERHPPTGREEGPEVAGTLGGGAGERGWAQDTERMTFIAHTLTDTSKSRAPDSQDYVVAATLSSGGHPNSNMPGRRKEDDVNLVTAFHQTQEPIHGDEFTPALGGTSIGMGVGVGSMVRRLTPTECERLQALPDGWTNPDGTAPDSRRYAALGDAVTSSVGEWIGRRILMAETASLEAPHPLSETAA